MRTETAEPAPNGDRGNTGYVHRSAEGDFLLPALQEEPQLTGGNLHATEPGHTRQAKGTAASLAAVPVFRAANVAGAAPWTVWTLAKRGALKERPNLGLRGHMVYDRHGTVG